MQLVKIDDCTFIDIEKILCLQEATSPNFTNIYVKGSKKIKVEGSLYKVKKIIENAMKEI